jgi:hypothetical protein
MSKSGASIYRALCEAGNLDTAVEALSPEDLTAVAEYLAKRPRRGGVPAQVWGLVSSKLNPEEVKG